MKRKKLRKLTEARAHAINRKQDLIHGDTPDLELPRDRVALGRGVTAPFLVNPFPKEVSLDGMLFPWDGEQPVFFRMPGSDFFYLACFSSKEHLFDFMKHVGCDYRSVKQIENGREFMSSFDGHHDRVKIILDPFYLPNGRVRFSEVRWA